MSRGNSFSPVPRRCPLRRRGLLFVSLHLGGRDRVVWGGRRRTASRRDSRQWEEGPSWPRRRRRKSSVVLRLCFHLHQTVQFPHCVRLTRSLSSVFVLISPFSPVLLPSLVLELLQTPPFYPLPTVLIPYLRTSLSLSPCVHTPEVRSKSPRLVLPPSSSSPFLLRLLLPPSTFPPPSPPWRPPLPLRQREGEEKEAGEG